MPDWFHDRRTHEFTPLVWLLVGIVLLLMGFVAFKECLEAMLSGRQYPGIVSRRQMSIRVPADFGAVLSLCLVTGGVVTAWAVLCTAFPALEARRSSQWGAAVFFCTLFVLILLLGLFVVIGRVW